MAGEDPLRTALLEMNRQTQNALMEMSRSIGGLESTVNGMVHTWRSQEASASQGRRDVHSKVDELRADVHAIGARLDATIKDVASMLPVFEGVKAAKAEVVGASKLVRWFYGLVTLAGGAGLFAFLSNYIGFKK